MKYLIFLFVGVWTRLFADCPSGGFFLWPEKEIISNGLIVFNTFGDCNPVAEALVAGKAKACLVPRNKTHVKISLMVQGNVRGEVDFMQVLLQPSEQMIFGEWYTLEIENMPAAKVQTNCLRDLQPGGKTNPGWKVLDQKATKIPVWEGDPEETGLYKHSERMQGTGVLYKIPASHPTETHLLVEVTVLNVKTQEKLTGWVWTDDTQAINVGHNACYGLCRLEDGTEFEISLVLVNGAGKSRSKGGLKYFRTSKK